MRWEHGYKFFYCQILVNRGHQLLSLRLVCLKQAKLRPYHYFRRQNNFSAPLLLETSSLRINLKWFCFLLTADAPSSGTLGCEIKAAPFSSPRGCQYSNKRTVKPDSNVTLNCSIRNNGTTLGKTWEQVDKTLKPNYGLTIKQANSTTRIYFTRKLISSLPSLWIYGTRSSPF